jgi:hypothetical protein
LGKTDVQRITGIAKIAMIAIIAVIEKPSAAHANN